ncbi:MAG TPA: hypothetical protein VMM76_27490 [Pirellulaceae bacterium]|nr:hypothetical protein [Pirellulaceae bacterium]
MRSSFAQYALVGLLAYSFPATAADNSEPVNPFEQPSPGNRTVSASISDEPDSDEERGFSLPKLSLPKLPIPTLPKPRMPKFSLPKLQMPKVSMPQWAERNPSPNAGPSIWQKLNNGTKNMLSKTRDTLMPWAANDDTPPVRHATGSRASTGITRTRVASNRGNGSTTSGGEKKSIFSSFLPASEPEAKPIRTTSDFLSQKRPLLD